MKYTYGTSEAAARRLGTIAEFFNPLAARFMSRYLDRPAGSGLDLGCGPGHTTAMLSRVLKGAQVYGLDNSAAFLEMAKKNHPQCCFIEHDVSVTPFPVHADVIYVRFLLSHLKNATNLVNRWVQELLAEGILFVDEVESIDTDIPVFREYLNINAALIRSQGADLYVGKTLASGVYEADVLCNEAVKWPVGNYLAATWFFPNTVTLWEQDKFVLDNVRRNGRKRISDELDRIKGSGDSRPGIVWTMRHLVLKRRQQGVT